MKGIYVVNDEYTNKEIKNYGAYQTFLRNTAPTLDGKLPEEALWKMNQPGFLRYTPHLFLGTSFSAFLLDPPAKSVEWVFFY